MLIRVVDTGPGMSATARQGWGIRHSIAGPLTATGGEARILSGRPGTVVELRWPTAPLASSSGRGPTRLHRVHAETAASTGADTSLVWRIAVPVPVHLQRAPRAGVDGLCLENDGLDALVAAIETVARGEPAFSGPLARAAIEDRALQARLTPAEVEVLRGLAFGLTPAQIARRTYRAPATVHSHVENIRRKYADATGERVNRARMLYEALRDGYLSRHDPPPSGAIT